MTVEGTVDILRNGVKPLTPDRLPKILGFCQRFGVDYQAVLKELTAQEREALGASQE